jgi:hypothetical protein
VHDIVLALPLPEIDQRHPVVVGVAADRGHERLAARGDQRRGGDVETEMPGQEPDDLPDPLQLGNVEVEIQPVDGLDLEHNMAGQHISCGAG